MTSAPRCSACGADWLLLWSKYGAPAALGEGGLCYWHSKRAAMANGGLPRADLLTPLDLLLRRLDRQDERDALRLRGVTYSVRVDGERLELTT